MIEIIEGLPGKRYQRTAQRISSGAVCRHLKIAGRVAFVTVFSDYQPPPPKLQHIRREWYAAVGSSGFHAIAVTNARAGPKTADATQAGASRSAGLQ